MEIAVKGILAVFWLVLVPIAVGRLPFIKRRQPLLLERFLVGYLILFFSYGDSGTAYDISENASACVDDFIWRGNPAPGSRRHLCDSETEGQVLSARYFM